MNDSPNLDLLRTLAVLFVVASHLPGVKGRAGFDSGALGSLGVALFFTHTTLVLLLSLQRSGEAAVPFFIRRFFRIFPLSVAVVLLVTVENLVRGIAVDWPAVLSNLLLVQNITGHSSTPYPLWSLPFEVQMYLVLPLLFAVAQLRDRGRWMARIYGAGMLLGLLALTQPAFGLLVFVPCFLPGAIAFVLPRRSSWSPVVLFGMVLLAAAIIPVLVAAGMSVIPLGYIVCLLLGLTIPRCREIQPSMLARFGKTVATYSYGIYLTHAGALALAFAGGAGPVQWATLIVLPAVFAWAAFHAVERPGIALGRQLAESYRARMTAPRPAAISPTPPTGSSGARRGPHLEAARRLGRRGSLHPVDRKTRPTAWPRRSPAGTSRAGVPTTWCRTRRDPPAP